ncbi:hypothetical protein Ancab_015185 [Ancistrocladus abbreviatus]
MNQRMIIMMERVGVGGPPGRGGGWREISPNCPRCGSSNTKFCYYNNYSLTQPRYFCKGCRRYWTRGGSLRNVPVGGGCRKSRRGNNTRPFRSLMPSSSSSDHGGRSFASDPTGYANYGSVTGSSTNSDGSNIDLAVVYANFLNQKPQNNNNNNSNHDDHQSPGTAGVEVTSELLSNEIDALANLHGVQLPVLENNAVNGMVFSDCSHNNVVGEFGESLENQEQVVVSGYGNFNDEVGYEFPTAGENLGVPMTLNTTSEWPFNSHSQSISTLQLPAAAELETEAQFSNLFVGSWSPLDLSAYEPSSSKP